MKIKTIIWMTAFAFLAGVIPSIVPISIAKEKSTATDGTKVTSKKSTKTKVELAEEAIKKLVSGLNAAQQKTLLTLLNDGDLKALSIMPGIGKSKGEAIIKARPFKSLEELRQVKGIGDSVFSKVITYGKTQADRPSPKSAKE